MFREHDNNVYFHGSTRSYEYDALHERRIFFVDGAYWIIIDTLTSSNEHRYELLFHLTESAQNNVLQTLSADTVNFIVPNLVLAQLNIEPTDHRVRQGYIAYQYGEKLAAPVISATSCSRTREFVTVVYPYQHIAPTLAIEAPAPSSTPQPVKTYQIRIRHGLQIATASCWFAERGDMGLDRLGGIDLPAQSKT